MEGAVKLAAIVPLVGLLACGPGYVETEIEVSQGANTAERERIADGLLTEELVGRLRGEVVRAMPQVKRDVAESIYVRWATTIVRPAGSRELSRTVVIVGVRAGGRGQDTQAVLSHCRAVLVGELSKSQR